MLTKEQNEKVTHTGPETPGGKLFRKYWQPVAMLSDIPEDGPLAVKALHQEMVLFRDEQGELGLLDLRCPHRGADLSYGRIEDGGLRCLYHGWVFNVDGQCLDQPAEPADRKFCDKVQQRSYPIHVAGGIVFAYLGEGEPPAFPEWECLTAPADHCYMVRSREGCNWMQGLEGDIDPYHLSYLHFGLKGARVAPVGDSARIFEFFSEGAPRMEVEHTNYGVRIYAMRDLGDEAYIRVSNYVSPNVAIVAGSSEGDGYMALWHVPIDDHSHFKYQLIFRRSAPVDQEWEERQAVMQWDPSNPDRLPERNVHNRWLQDRADMKDGWFSGLGHAFGLHDNWATEGMGSIYDRSKEHLGYGDLAIVGMRRSLLNAIDGLANDQDVPFCSASPEAASESIREIVVGSAISPDKSQAQQYFHDQNIATRPRDT